MMFLHLCPKILLSLLIISVALTLNVRAQETCPGDIDPVNTGKNCPCLYVDTDCVITDPNGEYDHIRGKKCGAINVEADSEGNYPEVQVKFIYSMCNYNDFDIQLTSKAKFYDWARNKFHGEVPDKKINIENPRFPLNGQIIGAGQCMEKTDTFYLDTSFRYNLAAQLQAVALNENGEPKDPKNAYCFAYKSKIFNIKRGLCKMQTSVTCDVFGSEIECQDFIDSTEVGKCLFFEAQLTWQACNLEARPMKIFTKSSNIKIGKKEDGEIINERIGQVGDLLGPIGDETSCETFGPVVRRYNTCASSSSAFFSINVQGTRPNGKYWYECQDFSFKNLIFKDEEPILANNATIAPSAISTTHTRSSLTSPSSNTTRIRRL